MENPFRLLETLDIPVSYFKLNGPTPLPYLIYKGAGSDNTEADNKIYYSANKYELEYYFDEKDEITEKKIEQLLNKNEIVWEKSDDIYIQSENMFVIYYYIF